MLLKTMSVQKMWHDFMDLEDEESIEMIKRDAYEQVQALLNLI